MLDKSQVICWVVTDGKVGMENQALGLAESLGFTPVVKRIRLNTPWQQLIPYLRVGLKHAFSPSGDSIVPPWPHLLIATGRASIAASLYVRQASRFGDGTGTLVVQLQDPVINPKLFDLVVVPEHDHLQGSNIISTRGGLHRVTMDKLHAEAEKFLPQIKHLPSPRIAVLVGGNNAVYQLTTQRMQEIVGQLRAVQAQTGGSLLVTPSRRTGDENLVILQQGLADLPTYIWDGQGYNPYYAMLGLADYLLVTCDSVNMVSEACTTGKPVYVIDLPGGSAKFNHFHDAMRKDGMTRSFVGRVDNWSYTPLDDMGRVVARVQQLIKDKKGLV